MRKHFTIIFYHRFWCRRSFPRVLPTHILNALELFVLILCLMFILWYVSVRYKSINERASFVKSSAHTKVNYPTITSTSCSTCTCCSVKPSTIIFCCSTSTERAKIFLALEVGLGREELQGIFCRL